MATWSLTPFFNELDVLEIRLATLDDVVDYHVIAESPTTHSGREKPLFFQENYGRFERWHHKIRHLVVEFSETSDWGREKEQRRALIRGFDGNSSDLILLSDLDEIPHPDAVRAAEHNILLCRMHVGKLNYRWVAPAHESHSICRVFRAGELKNSDLEELRLTHMPPLGPSGWHLSWMQGFGSKLAAFAHQEMVPFARPDLAAHGGPLFPGLVNQPVEKCGLADLPPYVAENRARFQHLLA